MLKFSELLETDKQPMYVAVKPDNKTVQMIDRLIDRYQIPKPIPSHKFHCTLIYSRKPTLEPVDQIHRIYKATINKFDIFNTRDGKRCLVLKLSSTDLQVRHKELMTELDASYDFPTYIPHITMSYDVGDFDPATLNQALTFDPIYLMSEYHQVLADLET